MLYYKGVGDFVRGVGDYVLVVKLTGGGGGYVHVYKNEQGGCPGDIVRIPQLACATYHHRIAKHTPCVNLLLA